MKIHILHKASLIDIIYKNILKLNKLRLKNIQNNQFYYLIFLIFELKNILSL